MVLIMWNTSAGGKDENNKAFKTMLKVRNGITRWVTSALYKGYMWQCRRKILSLSLVHFFFFDSGNQHDSIDHRIETHPQHTNFAVMFW